MDIREIITHLLINKYKEYDITVDLAKKNKKRSNRNNEER